MVPERGYNFKEDQLDVKKGLPKYLIKEVDSMSLKMANKLKTPALKASYLQLLNAKSEADYKNKLSVAVHERNRYYADRIAQTETFRAYSEEEARLHMEDKELTTIKIKMSSSHPHEDICDYHAGVNLYGLGAGVYPKEKAPKPPYHPYCRCRMLSKHSLDATDAKYNPNAPSDALNKFPLHVQRRIIGSDEKLMRFKNGEDFYKIIDEMKHRDYRLGFVGDINIGNDIIPTMTAKTIEDLFTKNLSEFNPEKIETFANLFTTQQDYKKHIEKRLDMGHIIDDMDYAIKTFTALAVANRSVFETYPHKINGIWDRILYDSEHKWVVILGENGKILTSYYMDGDFKDLIQKHKEQHGAKVLERKQSENLRTTSKQLRDRIKIFHGR